MIFRLKSYCFDGHYQFISLFEYSELTLTYQSVYALHELVRLFVFRIDFHRITGMFIRHIIR